MYNYEIAQGCWVWVYSSLYSFCGTLKVAMTMPMFRSNVSHYNHNDIIKIMTLT